jgi:hypothetical protein
MDCGVECQGEESYPLCTNCWGLRFNPTKYWQDWIRPTVVGDFWDTIYGSKFADVDVRQALRRAIAIGLTLEGAIKYNLESLKKDHNPNTRAVERKLQVALDLLEVSNG